MKSHFLFAVLRKEAIKKASRKFYQLGRWHQVGKTFRVLFCVVKSKEKKIYTTCFTQETIRQSTVFLLFVEDLNRAEKAVKLRRQDFHPEELDSPVTSVDAALAAQKYAGS